MEVLVRFKERFRSSPPAYSQELLDEFDNDDDTYLKNACSNRTRTDVPFLALQGGCLLILFFFLGYCMSNGDINRLTTGYDNCGNVCGSRNDFYIESEMICKSEDMTHKPFLLIRGDGRRKCVESCDGGMIVIGHRCILENSSPEQFSENVLPQQFSENVNEDVESFLNEIARDLHICSDEITTLCFIALGLAFLIFLVLRYMAGVFVWTVLIGVVLAFVGGTGYSWYLTDVSEGFLPLAIIASIITFVVILVILVMRKRIQLVIKLLKEAGKSITAMPLLLLEPLLTFVALGIAWSAWIYSMLIIESAGIPTEQGGDVRYRQNAAMRFTQWYNLFIMLWMVQFIYGCQNMIIAGAVSRWYFTRNKNKLHKPLCGSAYNMIKYHLGTISVGSLIIALIQIIRFLLRQLRRTIPCIKCCLFLCCLHKYVDTCMGYLESFMKYLTRNAYVVTSIHGYPFYESGTRAFQLLTENALRVLAINSVGDFVLVLAKVLVVASTVIIGLLMIQDKEHVQNKWAPLVLVGFVAFLIVHCFITVYEMAIDTIFICFCEDCEINDGLARPYFMSHELMEFVNKSKAVLGIQIVQEANPGIVIMSEEVHE